MFLLFSSIWNEGHEAASTSCVGRLASNLWLRENHPATIRATLGMPIGERPGWCPDVPGYVLSRR